MKYELFRDRCAGRVDPAQAGCKERSRNLEHQAENKLHPYHVLNLLFSGFPGLDYTRELTGND